MDPLTLIALLQGLGSIPGFFMHDNSTKNLLDMMQARMSPMRLNADTTQFYNQFLQSPAFAKAQASILGGAGRAQASLGASLGARGLANSGIGNVATSVGQGLTGMNMGNLYTSAWQNASQQALQAAQGSLNAGGYYRAPQNIGQNTYAALLGSLGPLANAFALRGQNQGGLPWYALSQALNGYNWNMGPRG